MRKLRILFVVRALDVGGMERLVISLIKGLDPDRYEPIVCAIEAPGQLAPMLTDAGIQLVSLDKAPGLSFAAVKQLHRIIRENDIDLVHTHNNTGHFYATFARRFCTRRVPLIHTRHGRETPHIKKSVMRNALCSRLSDLVVAVSHDVAEVCRYVEKVPVRKLRTIVNGVSLQPYIDAARKRQTASNIVFGHVGRLYEVKDQAVLLRVFSRFLATYPDSELALVGDGPLRLELERLATDLGIDKSVIFYGYRSDIPDLMAGFDCFVMSSLSEGTPLVVIEAMAAQCPVIGTDVGGMSEVVVEGRTGFLVASGDEDAMLERWMHLAANRERYRRIGIEGQSVAQSTYRLEDMIEQYEALYRTLL